jgi:L-ascorbate metabolism protein UlaG (beta-lactamase superfamily)
MGAMVIQWYGQSAFRLEAEASVFIDPFGIAGEALANRGLTFAYPAIEGVTADLVLITHEHFDHNAADRIDGSPAVIRSTAGRLDSPIGEVVAVASEHDEEAGTARGPNSIFVFTLGGIRVCHFGDFGQSDLRPEQADAIGEIDLLMIPVGDGPTIGAQQATAIAERLGPRWVVPMHYRTPAISFLETPDAFLEMQTDRPVVRRDSPSFDTADLDGPAVVMLAPPSA